MAHTIGIERSSTVTIEESIDECLYFIITENLDFNVKAKSDQKKKVYFRKNI